MKQLYTIILILAVSLGGANVLGQGSNNVTLLSNLNTRAAAGYNDCWGYTAPDGREYALLGVTNGTSIIDITDPTTPSETTFIPGASSIWKDIKTYQNYAYVVTEAGREVQIIDLSGLPASASLVASPVIFDTNPHNLFVDTDNGVLYGAEDFNFGASIKAFSLANPENPTPLASYGTDCHDIFVQDNILYAAEGFNGTIGIFDVSNPASPSLIQRHPIPAAGYVHNVWVTEDNNYMMTTEETLFKTVKYWDIQNISNIQLQSEYLGAENLAHNTHIKGDYAYMSHYRDGIRIIDLSAPTNIEEAGYYDTFPGISNDEYAGAWGAFPFFDSGSILISDQTTGLYVIRFDDVTGVETPSANAPAAFNLSANYPNPFNPSTTIEFSLQEAAAVTLRIFNSAGQHVTTLLNDSKTAGTHRVKWDGMDLAGKSVASGLYYYQLSSNGQQQTRKMLLLK